MKTQVFGIADYVVFGVVLLVSIAIGIYYRCTGGKQKTTEEYLLADRSMSFVPVAFSLMASFMSAITLLGVSAENYIYGTQFVVINIAYIIGTPIVAYVFLPVFFEMKAASAFEYIEKRFGSIARLVASSIFLLQMIMYMAIVLYAPSLALSAVTGVSKWASILSVGIVCTIYCTIGGIKAVLWTDVFQSFIMFIAMFIVIIKGTMDVGSFAKVWEIAEKGGRIQFFNFNPDPTIRHTIWTLAVGGIFTYVSIYAANQTQVQRLLTVKSLKSSQKALFLNWPITTFLSLTTSFTGLVVYANFAGCDPLLRSNETNVHTSDQILPYFVMVSLGNFSGLPGLFVAGIFSGALSTISSAINSLAAVTLEDFIKPIYSKHLSDAKAGVFIKLLVFLYGALCICLTYVAEKLGGILQSSLTIFGIVGGPTLAMFSLGMLTTKANQKGTLSGMLISLIICMWIGFGASFSNIQHPKLPISRDQCPLANQTLLENATEQFSIVDLSLTKQHKQEVFLLYKISYMWYGGLGWLLTFTLGLLLSLCIGEQTAIDHRLLSPVVKSCYQSDFEKEQTIPMRSCSL